VALRTADAGAALEVARVLGNPGAPLLPKLAAFEPRWTLERVVGTMRPRGGCVRVDVRGPRGEPAPALGALRCRAAGRRGAGRGRTRAGSVGAETACRLLIRATRLPCRPARARRRLSRAGAPRRRLWRTKNRHDLAQALERARASSARPTSRRTRPGGQGEAWAVFHLRQRDESEADAKLRSHYAQSPMRDYQRSRPTLVGRRYRAAGIRCSSRAERDPEEHARSAALDAH
jgi:hypothetical protein